LTLHTLWPSLDWTERRACSDRTVQQNIDLVKRLEQDLAYPKRQTSHPGCFAMELRVSSHVHPDQDYSHLSRNLGCQPIVHNTQLTLLCNAISILRFSERHMESPMVWAREA